MNWAKRISVLALACGLVAGRLEQVQAQRLEIPKPEPITLATRDGFPIKVTYYPGGVRAGQPNNQKIDGKRVTPVLILHGFKEQRAEYDRFALYLQSLGHAVIAPDLRGHGESLAGGRIDQDRMNRAHFSFMLNDVIACKRFLLDKNNAGQVNIDLLCVIGSGLGASVAINWAVYDWSLPQLPTHRQGRDVKGIVLISPVYSINGFSIKQLVGSPVLRSDLLPVLVLTGARDANHGDSKRIFKVLESGRADLEAQNGKSSGKRTAFIYEPDTSLSDAGLLNAPGLRPSPADEVARFIDQMSLNADNLPWRERRSPLSDDAAPAGDQ